MRCQAVSTHLLSLSHLYFVRTSDREWKLKLYSAICACSRCHIVECDVKCYTFWRRIFATMWRGELVPMKYLLKFCKVIQRVRCSMTCDFCVGSVRRWLSAHSKQATRWETNCLNKTDRPVARYTKRHTPKLMLKTQFTQRVVCLELFESRSVRPTCVCCVK